MGAVPSTLVTSFPHARRAVLALALAVGGCAWDSPMSTVTARSDFARSILTVYAIITWASVVIAAFGALLRSPRSGP